MTQDALLDSNSRMCGKCRIVRPLELFYIELEERRALNGGRKTWRHHCRICQRVRNNASRKAKQDYSDGIKVASGCTDCGLKMPEHPEVFDFDHIDPTQKTGSVASKLTSGSLASLKDEIAKCEVVCANCHRIRTRAAHRRRIHEQESEVYDF